MANELHFKDFCNSHAALEAEAQQLLKIAPIPIVEKLLEQLRHDRIAIGYREAALIAVSEMWREVDVVAPDGLPDRAISDEFDKALFWANNLAKYNSAALSLPYGDSF
jgi:hypothetical protein